MIRDRPQYLLDKKEYTSLPYGNKFKINFSNLHPLLQNDIYLLQGFRPITGEAAFTIEKLKVEKHENSLIKYYEYFDIKFQLILLIFSCFHYISKKKAVEIYPYSISLLPATKNGFIDERPIRSCINLPLNNELLSIYSNFNPFSNACGFFGNPSILYDTSQNNIFLDQIGWNKQFYLLATKFDPEDIINQYPEKMSEDWILRLNKYRTKRFYKKFDNKIPRQIWGIDSPIELFVLQGLAFENLFPLFQISLFADGKLYPSYWDLASIGPEITNKITEFDIYFPDKKIAIQCDGRRFQSKIKDKKIDNLLEENGIKVLRFSGREINNNLGNVIEKITNEI